jgi:hypothetical protein
VPTYVGRKTASSAGGAASVTLSDWTALAAGDVLLVFSLHNKLSSAATLTGWTLLGKVTHPAGNPTAYAWAKRIGDPATEPAVSVTWNDAAEFRTVEVQAWRDCDPTTILDGLVKSATGSTTITTPETSTATNEARVIHWVGHYAGNTTEITGTAPFDAAVDARFAALAYAPSAYLRHRSFSMVKSPAGATGSAIASGGASGQTLGFLVALKPGPPTGATTETSTAAATQDATVQDVAGQTEAATAGATAGWSYVAGPNEGDGEAAALADASQDATQADAGASVAAAVAGSTQDAAQGGAGESTATASAGATQDAGVHDPGGDTATSAADATQDADYLPPGTVVYPSADTWRVNGVTVPATVRVEDDLGNVLIREYDAAGNLVRSEDLFTAGADEAATAGATQDAAQGDAGELDAAATAGATQDGDWQTRRHPGWLARVIRLGWSWVGGPYHRIPLEQEGWADAPATAAAGQDAYFTEQHAVADAGASATAGAEQDAIFHIVEPKVTVRVPAIPYGIRVHAIPRGVRVAAITWGGVSVPTHRRGLAVTAHPLNVLVPVTRRR